jgi:hypothetical protein
MCVQLKATNEDLGALYGGWSPFGKSLRYGAQLELINGLTFTFNKATSVLKVGLGPAVALMRVEVWLTWFLVSHNKQLEAPGALRPVLLAQLVVFLLLLLPVACAGARHLHNDQVRQPSVE